MSWTSGSRTSELGLLSGRLLVTVELIFSPDEEAQGRPRAYQNDTRRTCKVSEAEGLTKKEAFRCLKRYIAREVHNHLPHDQLTVDSP